jgi:DNA-binding response OmpR family regulator
MSSEPRVLIVESNDALRAMLFTILRHQPIEVDTATNAEEALERVSRCDYALVMVDMDMPDQSGASFIRQFRAHRPEATTFILAVRDPRGTETFLDPDLVSAVLNKPLEIDLLAEIVRECARVVPAPADPLNCPPAESETRMRTDRNPYLTN